MKMFNIYIVENNRIYFNNFFKHIIQKKSFYRPEEIPVYNLTNDETLKVTWSEILTLGKNAGYEFPFEMQVWYPNGEITNHYWVYFLWSIFIHWLPAIFIDALLFIFRQPRL